MHLSVATGTSHKVGALLHNLIGGSQQTPPRPQLATPTNRLGFQEPKSKKLLKFYSPNPPRRTQTDAPNAMARTQEVLKSFSPKFHQSYKSLWGNKRGRTMEEIHKRLQDLDPNMFPSLRGEIDWWDCRSRSPLSNPSRICKNHWRMSHPKIFQILKCENKRIK